MVKSSVDRFVELQQQLVLVDGRINPGAHHAFNELHRYYGVPGLEAAVAAGYKTPEAFWTFYSRECGSAIGEVARRLGLK